MAMKRFFLIFLAALAFAGPVWALSPAQRVALFSGGPRYVIRNVTEGPQGGSSVTSATVAPTVNAGDNVLVFLFACNGGNACSASDTPSNAYLTGVSGTGIGTCSITAPSPVTGGAGVIIPTSVARCPVTASGNPTITGTFISADFPILVAIDLNVSSGLSISAVAAGTSDPVSVTASASTSVPSIVFTAVGSSGTVAPGSGWTQAFQDVGNALLIEDQVFNNAAIPVGTANVTVTNNWAALIQGYR